MADTPFSSLPQAMTLDESDVLAGVNSNATKKFYLSTILAWIKGKISPSDIGAVPTTRTVNNKALSADITLDASDVGAAPISHAASATTYGVGDANNYGHVKLSDTSSLSDASSGVAATPKLVNVATGQVSGMMASHVQNHNNPHQVTASQVGAAEAKSYPNGSITLLENNGYISSASLSACDRAGSVVAIAIAINLAGSIPTTRCEFGTLSGVPKPRANTAGLFQITNYLFSIQIATNGKVYITSIGQAQGASTWSGTPMLTYSTDGTILS